MICNFSNCKKNLYLVDIVPHAIQYSCRIKCFKCLASPFFCDPLAFLAIVAVRSTIVVLQSKQETSFVAASSSSFPWSSCDLQWRHRWSWCRADYWWMCCDYLSFLFSSPRASFSLEIFQSSWTSFSFSLWCLKIHKNRRMVLDIYLKIFANVF